AAGRQNLVALRIPQTVIVNRRAGTAAAKLAARPLHRAVVCHHRAGQVVVTTAVTISAGHDQRGVGGDGHGRSVIPHAVHPGQSAFDDVVADQGAGVLPGVGARHGAVDGELAGVQNGQSLAVGGDITTSQVAATLKIQLQAIGAVLHVNHAGKLVEQNSARENRVVGKLTGSA